MNRFAFLLIVAGCEGSTPHELPGRLLAPQLRNALPAAACGTDIAFVEGGPIELRFRYLYDAFGRLAFATGAYADARFEDTIEYRWDNLDRLTKQVQRQGWNGATTEIDALYGTLGDLREYTYRGNGVTERHTYFDLDVRGLPAIERIDVPGGTLDYALHYDAGGRLVLADGAGAGPTTVYTYDDDARTVTIDTDDGAWRGVIEYDDADHQLVERWDGTDPDAIGSEQLFTWSGDQLQTMTYRSGSEAAPRDLRVVEVDTYLYDCDSVR